MGFFNFIVDIVKDYLSYHLNIVRMDIDKRHNILSYYHSGKEYKIKFPKRRKPVDFYIILNE